MLFHTKRYLRQQRRFWLMNFLNLWKFEIRWPKKNKKISKFKFNAWWSYLQNISCKDKISFWMNKFWLSIIMYYLNFKCMYTYQPKSVNFSINSNGIGFYLIFNLLHLFVPLLGSLWLSPWLNMSNSRAGCIKKYTPAWMCLKIFLEIVLNRCWSTHTAENKYVWIIRGPIVATIVVSLTF